MKEKEKDKAKQNADDLILSTMYKLRYEGRDIFRKGKKNRMYNNQRYAIKVTDIVGPEKPEQPLTECPSNGDIYYLPCLEFEKDKCICRAWSGSAKDQYRMVNSLIYATKEGASNCRDSLLQLLLDGI